MRAVHLVVAALSVLVACDSNAASPGGMVVDGVAVPDGFEVELVADGFDGPTQAAPVGDGTFLLVELNGPERGGSGRVVQLDPADPGSRRTLVDGLLTPTGIAVDGDLLWIMEQRTLTVGPLSDTDQRSVVLTDLPFNGRSEGSLTTVAGGGILYNTSARRRGDVLVEGSGKLWYLANPAAEPEVVADGFKHAYAHAPTGDGRWFVTEISDGELDGRPPPDELVIAATGDDFGYPRCVGNQTPVIELGATTDECSDTPPSLAVFAPRSTPTSVTVAPWDPGTVLVALWNEGRIVSVPAVPAPDPHRPRAFLTGVEHPQFLLADGDRLLVIDYGGGRILAVSAST
jgi:glucose/arabinose dehydrogenase